MRGLPVRRSPTSGGSLVETDTHTKAPSQSHQMKILFLSEHGIVFRAKRSFATGTQLALGLEFRRALADLGIAGSDCPYREDFLMRLEGLVADCKVQHTHSGRAFQVTLLFNSLNDAERFLVGLADSARQRQLETGRLGRPQSRRAFSLN